MLKQYGGLLKISSAKKVLWCDDYEEDQKYNTIWISVCDECLEKHKSLFEELNASVDEFGSGICYCSECNNESSHYIDFVVEREEQ